MPNHEETAQTAVINAAWLERMRSTKPRLLRELFTMFLDDEPKRLAALAEAVAVGDLEQARYHAHSLKGAAATMGMERLRDACGEFELAAKAGNCPAELLEPIGKLLEEVFGAIRQLLATQSGVI